MSFRASRFCVAVSNIPARFLFFFFLGPGIWRLRASIFDHFGMAYGISRICSFAFLGIGTSVLPCFSAFLHPLDGRRLAGDDGLWLSPDLCVSSFGGGELYRVA